MRPVFRKLFAGLLALALAFSVVATRAPRVAVAANHDGDIWWNELKHDTHDLLFRSPFGAVPAGTAVTLRLQTAHYDAESVSLRIWDGTAGRELTASAHWVGQAINPQEQDVDLWEATVSTTHPTRLWYRWVIRDGAKTVFYADDATRDGGLGQPSDFATDYDYSITVYDPAFTTPDWLKNATIYQIFPDRFRNGSTANDPQPGDLSYGTDPVEPRTWNQKPDDPDLQGQPGYDGDGIWTNDFYGGDLAGVKEKLDYLKSLGVTAIYLNPIFEAPSNHGYDTTDYTQIKRYYGTNAEFADLAAAAEAKGIKLILDGVFNHTGADSLYFDRFSKYPSVGAYESQSSPYAGWYTFSQWPTRYDSWWGYESLPNLTENAAVRSYFYGASDAIARRWLQAGAAAWRLDVYPEVSAGFWREFRQAVKATSPDAAMIGEVWDDATDRFLGDELDSTMNYRFRNAALQFLAGGIGVNKGTPIEKIDAAQLDRILQNIREEYPPDVFYSLMNLVGSHDSNRVLDALGYDSAAEAAGDRAAYAAAKARLELLAAWQFTYPGAPTIYYGDEAGVTGTDDPDCRRTYPWADQGGQPDTDLTAYYSRLGQLRAANPVLRTGDLKTLYAEGDIYAFGRRLGNSAAVTVLNNQTDGATLSLDVAGYLRDGVTLTDALTGATYSVAGGRLAVTVSAGKAAILLTDVAQDLTAPGAPAGLTATAGSGAATISWRTLSGAAAYVIYRSTVPGWYQEVGRTAALTFTDGNLANGQQYFYTVAAVDAAGNVGAQPAAVTVTPAVAIGWGNLQWPFELNYVLQAGGHTDTVYGQVWVGGVTDQPGQGAGIRAQAGYGPVGTAPETWTNWVDAVFNVDVGNNDEYMTTFAPTAAGTYNYTYRYSGDGVHWYYGQKNDGGYGILRVQQSADTTPPGAPAGLTAAAFQGRVDLKWGAPADTDLFQYWIYRATAAGGYPAEPLAQVSASQLTFTDQGLDSTTTYYYVVRAVDASLNLSEPSNEVSALPQARRVEVTFQVQVPAYTPADYPVYIAGSFPDNSWNPGGIALQPAGDGIWQTTMTLTEGQRIDYKYARGSWDRVEKGAYGEEIANRSLTVGAEQVEDTVLRWRDLPLVVTAPADGAVVAGPEVTVSGNAYRNAGVMVNGAPVAQDEQGNFTTTVTAGFGETAITVATSGDGELGWSITLKVQRADTVPPVITGAPTTAPNEAGWYNGPVIIHFACSDADSGVARCPEDVTLTEEGQGLSVVGTAVDQAGNEATVTVGGINIDRTAPAVTFSEHPASYGVDETLAIACIVTDNLSGAEGCAPVTGPAYSYQIGENTVTRDAVDKAGNTGSGSVTFTVAVTYDGLRRLTAQFVTDKGLARSLTAKLDAAEKADGPLEAYIHELEAQAGKGLTEEQAQRLIELAGDLNQ